MLQLKLYIIFPSSIIAINTVYYSWSLFDCEVRKNVSGVKVRLKSKVIATTECKIIRFEVGEKTFQTWWDVTKAFCITLMSSWKARNFKERYRFRQEIQLFRASHIILDILADWEVAMWLWLQLTFGTFIWLRVIFFHIMFETKWLQLALIDLIENSLSFVWHW